MPLGPVALACVAVAVVSAFLRAKYEQEARRHRVLSPAEEDGERTRLRLVDEGPSYTPEGEAYLQKAKRYTRIFLFSAAGALLATWFRI